MLQIVVFDSNVSLEAMAGNDIPENIHCGERGKRALHSGPMIWHANREILTVGGSTYSKSNGNSYKSTSSSLDPLFVEFVKHDFLDLSLPLRKHLDTPSVAADYCWITFVGYLVGV